MKCERVMSVGVFVVGGRTSSNGELDGVPSAADAAPVTSTTPAMLIS